MVRSIIAHLIMYWYPYWLVYFRCWLVNMLGKFCPGFYNGRYTQYPWKSIHRGGVYSLIPWFIIQYPRQPKTGNTNIQGKSRVGTIDFLHLLLSPRVTNVVGIKICHHDESVSIGFGLLLRRELHSDKLATVFRNEFSRII